MEALLFLPVGMIVGTLAGFFGIGGGMILMPLLLLAGLGPAAAVAASLMFTFGTSCAGSIVHTRMNNVAWPTALIIGLTGVLAAQGANRIVVYISGRYDWLLNLGLIFMLAYFARKLYIKKEAPKKRSPFASVPWLASFLTGVCAGFLSSLLGIGGGFVIVPLLVSWKKLSSRKAVGTSLAAIMIISAGGVMGYSSQVDVNWFLGLCLIIGASLGSPIGAKMTLHYESSIIRKRLGVLYTVALMSIALDLLAGFFWSGLRWVSLAVLMAYLLFMLRDFYRFRHHQISGQED